MTERPRSKIGQLTDDIVHKAPSEAELRRRGVLLPELQLRPDTPTIEIDEATPVDQALTRLGTEQDGTLAIRETSGEPRAIVLSVERYLELAGKEINSARRVGTLDGRVVPAEAAFDRAHVEQVDPSERWGGD